MSLNTCILIVLDIRGLYQASQVFVMTNFYVLAIAGHNRKVTMETLKLPTDQAPGELREEIPTPSEKCEQHDHIDLDEEMRLARDELGIDMENEDSKVIPRLFLLNSDLSSF